MCQDIVNPVGLEYHNNGEYWFNLMKKIWVMRERS